MSGKNFPIERIILRVIAMPLSAPFKMSFYTQTQRDHVIVEMQGQGISGFGECALFKVPLYNHETEQTGFHVLKDYVAPLFFKTGPQTPAEFAPFMQRVAGHPIARGGFEMAFWDWLARARNQPLYQALGGQRKEVEVGVSLGICEDLERLADQIQGLLERGCCRVKLKIQPGYDVKTVDFVRRRFGDIPLTVDANSSYRPDESAALRKLDDYGLLMIEQPFRGGDIYYHSRLQQELKTPLCLDESIECFEDAEAAISLGSCRIINMKVARVGGPCEALRINTYARAQGVPLWCGGLLETGIGQAFNIALATLPNFCFPADIGGSLRYSSCDVIAPLIEVTKRGTVQPFDKPGIGCAVDVSALEKFTTAKAVISLNRK